MDGPAPGDHGAADGRLLRQPALPGGGPAHRGGGDLFVDNGTAPSKATVLVRHGGENEGEYAYLTMVLVNTPEGWKLSWTGLEK